MCAYVAAGDMTIERVAEINKWRHVRHFKHRTGGKGLLVNAVRQRHLCWPAWRVASKERRCGEGEIVQEVLAQLLYRLYFCD